MYFIKWILQVKFTWEQNVTKVLLRTCVILRRTNTSLSRTLSGLVLPLKKNLSIMFFSSLFSPLYYSRSISRQLFQLISCAGWQLFGGLVCHCLSVCMYLFILLFVVLNNVFICNYVITCLHCCGWNHFYTAAAYCRLPNNL